MGDMKKELVPKGYQLPVVYLNAGESDPAIASVKDVVEGAIISFPRANALPPSGKPSRPASRASGSGGCDSKEALALCAEKGVTRDPRRVRADVCAAGAVGPPLPSRHLEGVAGCCRTRWTAVRQPLGGARAASESTAGDSYATRSTA